MLLENAAYPQDERVRQEATTLAAAGYQVSVISRSWEDQLSRELVDGVHVFRFPGVPSASGFVGYLWEYGYSMLVMFALSLSVLMDKGFDIIHAHHPPDTSAFIAGFYKLFGKRYVLDHHDLAPELYCSLFGDGGNRLVYRTLVLLEKLSCRLADCVIATNESYKAIEMQRDRVPEQRIHVVRNGPSHERLQPVEPDPALRQRANTVLGYVGAMGPQDGVDYLLRAVHFLIYDLGRRDVFCVIVGMGSVLPDLKALAKELQIDEHVWFTGWVADEDMVRYLSTADICVDPDPSNPLNDHSTMAKMMEYMALGKPIVAFDLPEHRFSAQGAAVYAHPNDELDFARQIALLMDDPERRNQMGRLGKERVEKELGWSHQSKKLLHAYETLKRGTK
jgi:glycosyltransferase involved in cell wall biosynthesis